VLCFLFGLVFVVWVCRLNRLVGCMCGVLSGFDFWWGLSLFCW